MPTLGNTLMETQWLAVRCCCQPTKILGFIELDKRGVKNKTTQVVHDFSGRPHSAEIREIAYHEIYENNTSFLVKHELAVYSDDRPIEFWREIKGFIECPH